MVKFGATAKELLPERLSLRGGRSVSTKRNPRVSMSRWTSLGATELLPFVDDDGLRPGCVG